MNDIKIIIAENITALRQKNGLTQGQLAEELNYTDKAVSKWERGDSLPDVTVLLSIARRFGVTLDYLVTRHAPDAAPAPAPERKRIIRNHAAITGMSILLVWLIATLVFISLDAAKQYASWHWLVFLYAVPLSLVVWLVFNIIWFDRKRNYLIVSLLMWAVLTSLYLTLLAAGINFWLLFLLGIPGQIIILLWSSLRYGKNK